MRLVGSLGDGAFGRVDLYETSRGQKVAVKTLFKRADWEKEVELYRQMPKHPFLVAYLGSDERRKTIVMNYIAGTDGYDVMRALSHSTTRNPDWRYWRKVLLRGYEALATLHAAGIAHRDVKPSNILFTGVSVSPIGQLRMAERVDKGILILDPGLSCNTHCYGETGTAVFFSPQLLQARPHQINKAMRMRDDTWALMYAVASVMRGGFLVDYQRIDADRYPQEMKRRMQQLDRETIYRPNAELNDAMLAVLQARITSAKGAVTRLRSVERGPPSTEPLAPAYSFRAVQRAKRFLAAAGSPSAAIRAIQQFKG